MIVATDSIHVSEITGGLFMPLQVVYDRLDYAVNMLRNVIEARTGIRCQRVSYTHDNGLFSFTFCFGQQD